MFEQVSLLLVLFALSIHLRSVPQGIISADIIMRAEISLRLEAVEGRLKLSQHKTKEIAIK